MIRKLLTALQWAANHPMRQGSKWSAMRSFAQAQVAARLVQGDVCVSLANDTRLVVPPHMKGSIHCIWPGLYDFEEMSFVMHFLRPNDLFVDVGANIGVYTVLASGVTGARTIAFEPAQFAFPYLTGNIRLNALSPLAEARNLALGKQAGKIRFTAGLGTENHIVQEEDGTESVEVEVSTLDAQMKGLAPLVIKIDVEGFECDVLAGASACLAQPSLRAMIVEKVGNATKFGVDEAALHENIRRLGFVPSTYDPAARRLHKVPETFTGNIIYVRNPETAAARLREAPAYRFAGRKI